MANPAGARARGEQSMSRPLTRRRCSESPATSRPAAPNSFAARQSVRWGSQPRRRPAAGGARLRPPARRRRLPARSPSARTTPTPCRRAPWQAPPTRSRADRHHGQDQHRRPRHLPGPDQLVPPGHAGRRLDLVLRVPHAVLRRAGPGHRHQRRLGRRSSRQYGEAFKVGFDRATMASSTSSRSTCTHGRSSTARASSPQKGYAIPKTFDELKTLQRRSRRTACPVRLRRQGRLAGDGHLRHPQPSPNGYDFHVNLMAGKETWTDPKVTAVFET